ncbi:IS66 family insertion sequence element accessory protein TnpB [Sphingobium sp. MK2]|uniref:IS66 family insertion sequence element accessory protein TnpB n=1 Tax=Sphingobium sp. MK2 TaxID=3116540 RepID=UPI00386461CA
MRKGMRSLALQIQQSFRRDPHAGDLYVFRGRRGDLCKILWHDGIGMSFHDAVFRPSDQGALGNSKLGADLCFCQHSPLAEPVVAWAQAISFDEIDDAQVSELRICLITTRGTAGPDSLFIQYIRDFGTDMVVEKLVDHFDHLGSRFYLLCGAFGILRRQCFGSPAFEADMDPSLSFGRELEQGDVLDEVRKKALAFSVRQSWIAPDCFKVGRHSDQPITNCLIHRQPVVV